jgi:YVTN family beta-propeller protein
LPYVKDTLVLFNNTVVPGDFLASNEFVPVGVAYDNGRGEVFVTNTQSSDNNVSIISDSSNKVVAAVAVGTSAESVAYDSGRGAVFIANFGSNTVSVINDTSNTVVATVPVGYGTGYGGGGAAYDRGTGEVFVTNTFSNNVSVISDSTNTVVASVPVGVSPDGVAYDGGKGEVFVTNEASDSVSVISDRSDTVVATIAVGSYPNGVAYDSGKGEVFVANGGSNNMSVISDSTNTVLATVVGVQPSGVVYDGLRGEVFVTNGSNTVSVVSDVTNTLVATIPVGAGPTGVTYDSGMGEVFVTNWYCYNLSVISDTDNKVVAAIPVGSYPQDRLAYDSGKDQVLITDVESNSDTVSMISGATETVVATTTVGSWPVGVAYDSGKGELFVANGDSDNVSIISDTTDTVVATISLPVGNIGSAAVYDSGRGDVFVVDIGPAPLYSGNVSVINDTSDAIVATVPVGDWPQQMAYDRGRGEVFVTEFGPSPYGYGNISVISDMSNSVVATIPVGPYPQGLAYDSGQDEVFVADGGTNNVSVISDATNTVVTTVAVGAGPYGIAYDNRQSAIVVTDTGGGCSNCGSVSVISDMTDTVVATIPVGSVPLGVAYDSVRGEIFVENFLQGTVSIIAWPPVYRMTFQEGGLPIGTEWWVNVTGGRSYSSTTDTVSFAEPNGTFTYTVGSADTSWTAPGGSFTVVGVPASKMVSFGRGFAVTFVESGLLPGAEWFVNISGEPSQNSTTTAITTGLSNGSYLYTFGSPDSHYSLAGGELLVDGAPVSVPLTFGLPTFTVTVTESGLPSGTAWSATLFVQVFNTTYYYWQAGPGLTKISTTSMIVFVEPNGRYMCTAGGAWGYQAYIQGYYVAPLTVNGTDEAVAASFYPYSYPVTFTETGLPPGKLWGVFVNGYGLGTITVGPRSSVTVGAPNGTNYYALVGASGYRVSGLAATGNLTVQGAPVTESFSFVKGATYSITFTERGLVKGRPWCVTLVNRYSCLTTGSGTLSGLSPGTYPYTILPLPGQTITAGLGRTTIPLSGWLTLSAASLSMVVTYVYPYNVTFSETGLPNGTNWCVAVGSSRECSTNGAVVFRLGNGSYVSRVGPVAGYLYVGNPSERAKVVGGPTTVTVKFVHRHHAVTLYNPSTLPVTATVSRPLGVEDGGRGRSA